MERPLEDATTANLWKTLFALIVELSLQSGLVTQEELVPALATTLTNEGTRLDTASQAEGSQEQQKDGDGQQEIGEESSKEEDPIVEVAHEPDAETEPGATTGERMTPKCIQVSPRAIVRVLVRGSNYGTNSSRTVTTSCNPKDS